MFNDDEGYTTPEGFWLPRRLLLPDVRDFSEVLTYVREWDHSTMNHTNGKAGAESLPDLEFDGNHISPFCSTSGFAGPHRSVAVRPTELTLEAIRGQLVTMGDSLSFKVILHADRERALVIIDHNQIIGSRWLAYIDPSTIPAPEESER